MARYGKSPGTLTTSTDNGLQLFHSRRPLQHENVVYLHMSKKNTTTPPQLFVVETLHTFRMRYLVESETAEEAEKIVDMPPVDQIIDEWQQKYVGDTILTSQPISRKEAEEMHTEKNASGWEGSPWMPIDSMIRRLKNGV